MDERQMASSTRVPVDDARFGPTSDSDRGAADVRIGDGAFDQPPLSAGPTDVAAARILVVDDVAANVELLGALLKSAGFFDVIGVTDAATVESVFRELRPDMVLLDLHMPGIDGTELLQRLRRLAAGEFVPMVVVTGDVTVEARERALASGATDFLTKPLDRLELILRCGNMLETRMLYKRLAGDHESMRSELRRRLVVERISEFEASEMTGRIARVLDGVDGFTMHCQPIVELDSGRPVGFEALARFPHGSGRSPDAWFADAERVGLGAQLELFAARHALGLLDRLADDVFVSVNVAPQVACLPAFADLLSGVDGRRVVIELTEHAPHLDIARLGRCLGTLKRTGVRIAMDDAGAGYSGLHRLLLLRPDVVKVDRLMAERLEYDTAARVLTGSLVAFCEDTGARVVVEGVETEVVASIARDLGIQLGQGYLHGRPAPIEEWAIRTSIDARPRR